MINNFRLSCKARELTNKIQALEKGDDMNQTLGHTPGPWTHTLNESGSMRGVWGKPKGSNITGMVCYMTNPVSANQEGAANAHLIGAAPELLAAAIDMVAQVDAYDYVHGRDSCDIDPDGLRLAIAKARGVRNGR